MCGLYGMLGDLSYADKETLRNLGWMSMMRGIDSSGIALVSEMKEEASVIKVLGRSTDLHDTIAWDRMTLGNKLAVLGHCRSKTVGPNTKAAAHPYTYGHITGTHNGTLRRYDNLPCGKEITDSATLFRSISEIGARDTIEQIAGAYALVWHDSSTGLVNFIRNSERTLFYGLEKDSCRLIWASESWMIHIAAARGNISLLNLAEEGKPEEYVGLFEPDNLYKVQITQERNRAKFSFLNDEVERIEGDVKKPSTVVPFAGRNTPPWDWRASRDEWQKSYRSSGDKQPADESASTKLLTDSSTSTTSSSQTSQSQRSTLTLGRASKKESSAESTLLTVGTPEDYLDDDLNDLYDNQLTNSYGKAMTAGDWTSLPVEESCQFCQTTVTHSDAVEHLNGSVSLPGVWKWLSDKTFLCTSCKTAL